MSSLRLVQIAGDDPGLFDALSQEALPVDDLKEPGREFFRIEQSGGVVAYGGYELTDGHALLRSIAVLPAHKGKGCGVEASGLIIDAARAAGAIDIWLLTTILQTQQASSLCPSSATLMRYAL